MQRLEAAASRFHGTLTKLAATRFLRGVSSERLYRPAMYSKSSHFLFMSNVMYHLAKFGHTGAQQALSPKALLYSQASLDCRHT